MSTILTDDFTRLYYQDVGSADAPTLILVSLSNSIPDECI